MIYPTYATFDYIFSLCSIVVNFFGYFFNLMFIDLWSLVNITSEFNPYISWLIPLLDFTQLDILLSEITLAYLLFSLTVAIIVIVRYFGKK